MAKLTRQTMLWFGSNSDSSSVGIFGSLAAGSPTYSKVISTIQSLPAWGSGWKAEVIASERPAIQDFNAVDFVLSYGICYLHEMGIPEWDSGTIYYQNSFCQIAGVIYQSLQDNNQGNSPASSPTYWSEGSFLTLSAQNLTGVKTFLSFPITPLSAPTTDYQVANKKYVDDNVIPGAGTITSTMLKTATGEVSGSGGNYTLPGGEYGFYPQTKGDGSNNFLAYLAYNQNNSSYITCVGFQTGGTAYAKQRYVTSSGEDMWIFLLLDKITKEITGAYQAPDHPAYGNGGDFDKVPHPFLNYDKTKHEVILLDNYTCIILKQESKDTKKSILTLINENYRINIKSREKYVPLHSGQFINDNGEHTKVIVKSLPEYITVRKLIKK